MMKGHFNKPICAIMTSLVLILGTFALVLPYQEAEANHDRIRVQITIITPGPGNIIYLQTFPTACDPSCSVNLNLNNRDEGRFDRFCGPTEPVTVVAGQIAEQVDCFGPGPWKIIVSVSLQDEGGLEPHNDNDIVVTVGAN